MILYPVKNTAGYTIGGKAKGLVQLLEAGVTVPDFLVLPAENFDAIIRQSNNDPAMIHGRLLQYVLHGEGSKKLQRIIDDWKLHQPSVIVRSSIADEDGALDAFAGIMDSFSNLTRYDDVMEAIAKCAASAYSAKAAAYRKQKGLSLSARPAVIVQQQIIPDVSGVVFTTYPIYPQEMAIHAVWGFGEGLVNGELDADEFYLMKKAGIINRQKIAHKEKQVTADKQKGTQTNLVTINRQDMPCLTKEQMRQIFTISSLLEKKFNHPQDIEFAFSKDNLYLVQTRRITQAIPEVVVYDNSNIQESFCGVTSPLTFSFAQRAYATVYRQTMQILSLSQKVIEAYDPVVNNLLGLIQGRIYYNINNWYRGLQLLPSFKQNKKDMERMMGVEEPIDFITDTEKSFTNKLKLLPSLLINLLKLLSAFSRLQKSVADFQRHFRSHYEQFYQLLPGIKNSAQIIKHKKILDKELLQNWTTPIINDFYVMMINGRVRRKLLKAGFKEPEEFLSRYFAGNQQLESAQPAVAMQKLSFKATQQQLLKTLIIHLPDDVHDKIREQFPAFYSDVQRFILSYGDRTVGELKLETITMRLSPKIFYSYLRNYLTASKTLQVATQSHLHQSAENDLEEKLKNHSLLFKRSVYGSLQKLQKAIQYREAMRLERTRLFGMYRALYLAAGNLLFTRTILASSRDIFYLTETEIRSLLLQHPQHETAGIVEERKAAFERYKNEDVPARVIIPSPPANSSSMPGNDDDALYGTGCVPGNVTAEVMVITSPDGNLDVGGKIICALRTDPGWVALFPACKGVLIEKGSALSHSVILLREFGIPAIINITGLTRKITAGQTVSMDGTTGLIKILNS